MIRQPISRRNYLILNVLSVVVFVAAYSWLSYRQHEFNAKDTTIPNFSQIWEGVAQVTSPDDGGEIWLWEDMKVTLTRHLGGMIIGVTLAFFIGMSMGVWKPAEAFFLWPVNFFAKIPPTAMMAVYFVIFGIEYKMFVAMVALGVMPTLAQSIHQSAKNDVPQTLINKAYTLGASHFETIWYIVLKQILPRIIESVRLQIGPALVFLIAAELLVGDVGFGYRLRIQSRLLNMNVVYFYLFTLGVSFYFMDWMLIMVRSYMCPWHGGEETTKRVKMFSWLNPMSYLPKTEKHNYVKGPIGYWNPKEDVRNQQSTVSDSDKILDVKNVSKSFGHGPDRIHVLDNVSLEIKAGQIVAIVGPSGCGKTTFLKAILGTQMPDLGKVHIGDELKTGPSRNVGIVYQDYVLPPHMKARDNVAFGPNLSNWNMFERIFKFWEYRKALACYRNEAQEFLERLDLKEAGDKYPHELSGGMRQRVAIAQALIMKPKIVLLDEPFGALDEAIREELQVMLLHLYQDNLKAKENGKEPPWTIFMVTHELREAIYVSDRVIGLSQHYKDKNTNGARIVYDKSAPIFHPHDPKEYEMFEEQIEELKEVVLSKKELANHNEFVTFWDKQQEKEGVTNG
ncbi:MAG: ATP-binding cassette domain-containing protein [Candidatus Thorarchaeota archaeon]|jgi:ABC-type nitrate/sulfonate/bicarbonate transport system ATPase subunit/ABC-type nitrate/sulfonate/bicarbonate transport system permease component